MFMLKHLFSSQSQPTPVASAIKVEGAAVVKEREGENDVVEGEGKEGGVEAESEGESEDMDLDLGEKRKHADRNMRRQQQQQQWGFAVEDKGEAEGEEVEEEMGGRKEVMVPIRDKSLNGPVQDPEAFEEEEQSTGPVRGKNRQFVKTAKGKRGRKSKSLVEEDDAEPKPKLKRGRRAKKSDVVAEVEDDTLPNGDQESAEPAKKPGRPRKRQSDVEALSEACYIPPSAKNREIEEEAVPAPERKTSRRKSSEKQASEESSIPPELVALPAKLERAKKKARLSSEGKQPALDTHDDENYSAAPLHQPLTMAHYHRITQSSSWDDAPTSAQPQRFIQPDEEPPPILPPSKKALGKRKASDVAAVSNKKPKRNSKAGGADLRDFGFTSDNDKSISGSCKGNNNSYAADEELNEMERTSAISRLQQQPRRATPKFTPINPRLVPRVEISSARKEREHIPNPTSSLEERDFSNSLPQQLEPEPEPKSSGRQKRRLPVDEPDQSTSKILRKRDLKPKSPKTSQSPSTQKEKSKPKKKSTPKAKPEKSAKTGRLTTEQYETIYAAVESWMDQYDLTQFEMNEVIQSDPHKNSNAKELFNFVCEEASEIPRAKIINACRRKFHNFERGAFTEEQDDELRTLYEQNPGKWKEIAQAMNRFPEDCRDRWRNYVVCGDKMRKDVWDRKEEDRLRNVVAEVLESIRELQPLARNCNNNPESLIDWNIVSQKMDLTRSRLQCLSKWKQLKERMDTDAEDPIAEQPVSDARWRLDKAEEEAKSLGPSDKLNLLYAIRDWAPGREGKIPWRRIRKAGLGTVMTLRVAFRDMKERVPDSDELKLQALIDWLIDAFETAAPDEPPGFTEGFPRSSQKNKRPMLKRKRKTKEKFLKEDESNGEGPSKSKFTRRKKEAMIDEMERNDVASSMSQPVNRKKKRKLRDRMKEQGESVSQEATTADAVVESDGFLGAFETLKNGKGKGKPKGKERAKKPIATATARGKEVKKILSEEKVVESEEDLELEDLEPEVEPVPEPEPDSAPGLLSPSQSHLDEHEHERDGDVEVEVESDAEYDAEPGSEPGSESESESESESGSGSGPESESESEPDPESEIHQNGELEEVDDGDKMDLDEDPANEERNATPEGPTATSSARSSNSSSASESESEDKEEPTPRANGVILNQASEASEDEESEEQDENEEEASSEEQNENEDGEMISGESFHDTESIDLDAPTQLESDDDEGNEDEKEKVKIKEESWGWAVNGYLNGMNDSRTENENENESENETDTSESSDEGSIPAVPREREESREL